MKIKPLLMFAVAGLMATSLAIPVHAETALQTQNLFEAAARF